MTLTTKQKKYQAITWDGSEETAKRIEELFPEAELFENVFFIPSEIGLVNVHINNTIVVTDTVLLSLTDTELTELFEEVL